MHQGAGDQAPGNAARDPCGPKLIGVDQPSLALGDPRDRRQTHPLDTQNVENPDVAVGFSTNRTTTLHNVENRRAQVGFSTNRSVPAGRCGG
jgi:hypothetical protein